MTSPTVMSSVNGIPATCHEATSYLPALQTDFRTFCQSRQWNKNSIILSSAASGFGVDKPAIDQRPFDVDTSLGDQNRFPADPLKLTLFDQSLSFVTGSILSVSTRSISSKLSCFVPNDSQLWKGRLLPNESGNSLVWLGLDDSSDDER